MFESLRVIDPEKSIVIADRCGDSNVPLTCMPTRVRCLESRRIIWLVTSVFGYLVFVPAIEAFRRPQSDSGMANPAVAVSALFLLATLIRWAVVSATKRVSIGLKVAMRPSAKRLMRENTVPDTPMR